MQAEVDLLFGAPALQLGFMTPDRVMTAGVGDHRRVLALPLLPVRTCVEARPLFPTSKVPDHPMPGDCA